MKKTVLLPLLFLTLLFPSCERKVEDASFERGNTDFENLPSPSGIEDRFAYVMGYQMAAALSSTFPETDPLYMAAGAVDYSTGSPLFTKEEMVQIAQSYQSEIYRRAEDLMQSLREENLASAQAFLETNAERSSVISISSEIEYEYLDRSESDEHPSSDSTVTVNYRLFTLDGEEEARGEVVQIFLPDTIEGFSAVVTRMGVGDRVRAWVHPNQGYGAYGNGNIEPNQLLIFDIELLSIED